MIKQLGLLADKAIHRKPLSGHDRSTVAPFNRHFRRFHKHRDTAEILIIQEDTAFHTKLSTAIPESAAVTRVQLHELRKFRDRRRFNMLFYSSSSHNSYNDAGGCSAQLLEDLCYCRILLRPGAFLFLPVHDAREPHAGTWFRKAESREDFWLRQAGFMNHTPPKFVAGYTLACGRRPAQRF